MIRRACYRFVTHDGGRRGVTPMRPDEGSPRARAASVPNGDSRIVRLGGPAGARSYPGIKGSNRREPLLVPLLATALASPIAANGDLGICHRYVHHPTRGTCGESFDVECLFHLIHPNHPAGTLSPSQDPALFNVREHAAPRCSQENSVGVTTASRRAGTRPGQPRRRAIAGASRSARWRSGDPTRLPTRVATGKARSEQGVKTWRPFHDSKVVHPVLQQIGCHREVTARTVDDARADAAMEPTGGDTACVHQERVSLDGNRDRTAG